MLNLSRRSQLGIGLALAALMAVTRGHHFMSIDHLPGASWAVFLLAGVYLRSYWVFAALLAEAALIDYGAITWGGVSSFCVTPAYGFLLPAYGSLWLAGRWYAGRYRFHWTTLPTLGASAFVGAFVCELFSSGGFYFLSGRFVETNLSEFGVRLATYFPGYLGAVFFYVALAVLVHVAFVLARRGTIGSQNMSAN